MKVLHISSFDNGGAGIAAVRLHKTLLKMGVDSKVLVMEKRTNAPEIYQFKKTNKYFVLFQRVLKNLGFPLTLEHYNDNRSRKFKGEFEFFSFAKTSFPDLVDHPLVKECDVINLHWVANFLDYSSFFEKIDKPVIWTQHDMNAFQGGFHYKADDIRNKQTLLAENEEQYQCKLKALGNLTSDGLVTISPSKWMRQEAASSEILGRFSHFHIPNGIDPLVFSNSVIASKKALGLDKEKITILFVSESVRNLRKGFNFIAELVKRNDPLLRRCEFVAVGNAKKSEQMPQIKYMGSIHSETKISQVYRAADIYLLASKEDNLPNVMLESLAVGTPIAAFNTGGMRELIINGFNGFLSDEISAEGLYQAVAQCIEHLENFNRDAIANDLKAKFSLEKQANAYMHVYENAAMQMH